MLLGDDSGTETMPSQTIGEAYAYGTWMRTALKSAEELLGEEGLLEETSCLAHELSPHSFKKECEERLTTEPGGPPATSAFMRCGQNLNAVLRRYVRDDKYSDELCGRICAGYRTHDIDFGTLPPRFNKEKFPNGVKYSEIIPGHKKIKERFPHFAEVLKYGIASVVYHHNWLAQNLPEGHDLDPVHIGQKVGTGSLALKEV